MNHTGPHSPFGDDADLGAAPGAGGASSADASGGTGMSEPGAGDAAGAGGKRKGKGKGASFGLGGGRGMPDRPLDASDAAAAAAAVGSGPGDQVGPDGLPLVAACEVAAARERLSHTAADLRTLAAGLWSVGTDDLAPLMSHLDAVRSGVEIASALATRDALARGVVDASQQASPGQWVRAQAPTLEPGEAAAVGQVAKACTQQPRHELLQSLVALGVATTKAAATALREVSKILPDLDLDVDYDEVLGWYLKALMDGAPSADLRRLSARLRDRYGSAEANKKGEKAHGLNALDVSTLPDGARRYLLHLCPEYAAVLDAALATLSGPQPSVDPDTGEQTRDERTPARRRAEALVEIVKRSVATDPATSATATTKLILTMSLQDLLSGTGSATTREGELLDAGTARRLACDADVVPAVLGGGSEILDWGTERRLFDGPLRAAIVARDRACTFPACDRPPTWCQAHHLIHWIDGGKTALTNAALLCQRHHTIVHRDNLAASIVDHQVVWDTTPNVDPPTSATGYPPIITTHPDHDDRPDDEPGDHPGDEGGGGGDGPAGGPEVPNPPDDNTPENTSDAGEPNDPGRDDAPPPDDGRPPPDDPWWGPPPPPPPKSSPYPGPDDPWWDDDTRPSARTDRHNDTDSSQHQPDSGVPQTRDRPESDAPATADWPEAGASTDSADP